MANYPKKPREQTEYDRDGSGPRPFAWIKGLHQRRNREQDRRFICEGIGAVEQAARNGWAIERVLHTRDAERLAEWRELMLWARRNEVPMQQVAAHQMERIGDARPAPPVLAIVEQRPENPAIPSDVTGPILMLDRLQDPGNVGTLLRIAAAFGVQKTLLGEGCVDVYSPKIVRASAGYLFARDFARDVNLGTSIAAMRARKIPVFATAGDGGKAPADWKPDGPVGIVLGNEGSGVSRELLDAVDGRLSIPVAADVDSLNVGIAGGIVLARWYEWATRATR
jgi:TrmH family RNA methyltransferase